ncbi:WD40-repeat-containing domain protein [Chytriomyces sp. MP71]|nr:WD40-repeat-containing domain protein [Chytriomyces sp. MP71]
MIISSPAWVTHPGEKGRKLPIYACHVQPNGMRLATGGQDAKVKLWNVKPIVDVDAETDASEPRLLSTLSLHSGAVLCVRFSCGNGRLLASGSDDAKIVIWGEDGSGYKAATFGQNSANSANVEQWRAVKVLFGHDSDVADLAWSPNNEYLASCGLDSRVYIWDGNTFEKLKKLDAFTSFVKGVTWDPVGKYLATQSDDKTVKIWRTSDWVVEREITEPYNQASSTTFFRRLSWSPDGSCIATANGENGNMPVAPIINRDTWASDVSLVGHQAPIEVACFNPITFEIELPESDAGEDSTRKVASSVCAIGGQDRGVSVWWTARSFSAASTMDVFQHSVLDLSWSSDGFTLFACSYDGTVSALTFSKVEFGVPVSAEETETALSKYGFQKVKQAVPESTTQLALEDAFKAMESNGVGLSGSPAKKPKSGVENAATALAQQVNVIQMGKQRESRTKDGKKRIQPVLIRSGNSPLKPASLTVGAGVALQQSIGLNNGVGIPTVSVGAGATKRKAGEEGASQENASKQASYILPTYTGVSPPTRLLAIPAVKPRLVVPISTGSTVLNLEAVNLDNARQDAKIHGSRNGELSFTVSLPSYVIAIVGSSEFWVAACLDASVNIFSAAGRRIIPPMALPSPVSFISTNGEHLMVILTHCCMYIWNIHKQSNLLTNEPITPLISKSSSGETNSLKLLNASIRSDGKPAISTSAGDTFVFHYDMKVWMNVRGFDADRRLGTDAGVNAAGFKMPVSEVLGKNSDLVDRAELGMACASILGLPADYRNWLLLYARKLSDEGVVSKVKELCDDLMGSLDAKASSGDVMGMAKRGLLKEILPILASNRDLQRVVSSYHDFFNQ